jgi:hypothetical protein
MAKKVKTPEAIEARIAELRAELVTAREQAEAQKWTELARLVKRAGVLDDALTWARSRAVKPRTTETGNG